MSGFLRLLGSICIFGFIAVMFVGSDLNDIFPKEYQNYAVDLKDNKWFLLILGIVLSIFGTITKVKEIVKKRKAKVRYRVSDLSNESSNYKNSTITDSVKKDYLIDEYQHKVRKIIDKQHGKLKETALKVDWTPLSSGGANFKTASLKRINSTRIEIRKSKGGFLFGAVFALVGLGISIFISYDIVGDKGATWQLLLPILFGSVFTAAGLAMLYWPRPRIFDRRQGWFWAGNKSLAREQDLMKLKKSARLSEIAAIQVITERVSGSKGGSYHSWEINLVSNDGARLNVMDHGNKDSILSDAQLLGEFLNVPVWDNT